MTMHGSPAALDALLDREALRRRLESAGGRLDEHGWLSGDEGHERALAPEARTPAAVLIGLVARPQGPQVILTQRTAHLKDHAGQISLPGGRIEDEDEGPAAAALREALEEIGLAPDKVELLGGLRHYDTITGFRIHPVVGWIEPPVEFAPDPFEVAEVFEVPLEFFLKPGAVRKETRQFQGTQRFFYVFPYEHRYIWGATAGMLVNLVDVLNG
jgi:8-oxo-dGTP pyrophosphatase MutT (NUDIX family)